MFRPLMQVTARHTTPRARARLMYTADADELVDTDSSDDGD